MNIILLISFLSSCKSYRLKFNRLLRDFSFWALLAVNVYSAYYYFRNPAIFTTLIWLYWTQSVIIGVFNFLDIITLTKAVDEKVTTDKGTIIGFQTLKTGGAFFFAIHYGFFHFVYFFFLIGMKISGPFDLEFFRIFLMLFLGSQIISFVQHKIQYKKSPPSITKLFFTPYLRIIPMHLCILIPGLLGWGNMQIFVVLKVIADMAAYVVTSPYYKSPVVSKAA